MFDQKENWSHLILTEETVAPGNPVRKDELDSHSGLLESCKSQSRDWLLVSSPGPPRNSLAIINSNFSLLAQNFGQ